MNYLCYLLRRLLYSVIVLFGLSIIIFFISRVLPGEPARMALGPFATADQVQHLRQLMGLDKPLIVQYITYIFNLFHGDFGISLVSKRNVILDLKYYLPATLELIFFTTFWVIFLGIPFGVISAINKDKLLDSLLKTFTFTVVVTPGFIIGIVLQLVFGYLLNIMPITGRLSPALISSVNSNGFLLFNSFIKADWQIFIDGLKHIILPSLALSMAGVGQVSRIARASMLEISEEDYISVMRSYGVPRSILSFIYMLKPAFLPTLNIIGMTFASLLGNAFLIERVYSWPGIAKYGINSLLRTDINALMGVVLLIGTFFLLVNFVVDILMRLFDPRIGLLEGD